MMGYTPSFTSDSREIWSQERFVGEINSITRLSVVLDALKARWVRRNRTRPRVDSACAPRRSWTPLRFAPWEWAAIAHPRRARVWL